MAFSKFKPYFLPEEKHSKKRIVTLGIELEAPIREFYRMNFLPAKYRDNINFYYQDIYDNFIDPLDTNFFASRMDAGLETVSQPFSYKWYLKNKDIFTKMLNIYIEKGFKDGSDGSGMHVHISKEAFTVVERTCLFKFLDINKEPVFLFTDRAGGSYASQGFCTAESLKAQPYGPSGVIAVERKSIPTKEFRLFQSTLKEEKFFSNIEFVYSLYEYITKAEKNISKEILVDNSFTNYITFVLTRPSLFHNLIKTFIKFGFTELNTVKKKRNIVKSVAISA